MPAVVDSGHRRALELSLEMPDGELEAAMPAEQFDEILDRIAGHVAEHRTTLVFVNTRNLSERVAHELGERLGEDQVAAHHGSLSRERRQRVENRLRAGELRALVATASLELGIDVGPVELVCQLGSPHSIATFLQRVGRANHQRDGSRAGSSTRPRATSWSSAPRCWRRSSAAGSMRFSRLSCRSTSSPSRSSPRPRPAERRGWARTSCSR